MPVDWDQVADHRQVPLVIVMTRYLPHFRQEIFKRLSRNTDFQLVFLHSAEVPADETGLTSPPLPNSHTVKLKLFGRMPLLFVNQPESARLVKRYNPDVILCEPPPTFISVGRSALRQRLRGQGVVYWTKGASPIPGRNPLVTFARNLVFRVWLSAANVLVGYGQTSKKYFQSLGFSPDRIVVAQNTIDTSSLLADPEGWLERGRQLRARLGLEGRIVIGTVSRLIPEKRIDLVIEAAAILAKTRPNISVLVGGRGPAIDELRQLAARHPHLDTHILGELPVGGDNEVFAASDVNVFSARVGLAIVQSMALGKPTVIADEPFADAELIEHEQTGLRYRAYEAEDLAAQIGRVLDDPALAQRLGEAGRKHVVENATIENMVNRLAEAIRLALRVRRNARPAGNGSAPA